MAHSCVPCLDSWQAIKRNALMESPLCFLAALSPIGPEAREERWGIHLQIVLQK